MHRTPRIWLRDWGGDSLRKMLTAQAWEPEVDSPGVNLAFSRDSVFMRDPASEKKMKIIVEERQDSTSTSAFHTGQE